MVLGKKKLLSDKKTFFFQEKRKVSPSGDKKRWRGKNMVGRRAGTSLGSGLKARR